MKVLILVTLLVLPACASIKEIAKETALQVYNNERETLLKAASEIAETKSKEAEIKAAEAKDRGDYGLYALWALGAAGLGGVGKVLHASGRKKDS